MTKKKEKKKLKKILSITVNWYSRQSFNKGQHSILCLWFIIFVSLGLRNDNLGKSLLKNVLALQAKIEAKTLIYNPHWIDQKEKVMEEVLSAKAAACPEFCNTLTCSDSVLAEAVPGDLFWSTGLTKEQCLIVKKSAWPGKNRMGKILSTLKERIIEKNNDE